MDSTKKAIEQWPDEQAREYLNWQFPDEVIEWMVMDETGLYGYKDSIGNQFACADDDETRTIGITQFLIRNGGSYVSNAEG